MEEQFLSYLWRYKLLSADLRTTAGETVEIIRPGEINPDSGPDFLHARIKIGSTTWAGHVELHVRASDWYAHGHHDDPAYAHLILHLVYEDDLRDGPEAIQGLPVAEVKGFYAPELYARYRAFMENRQWVACAPQIRDVEAIIRSAWLERLAFERFERKAEILQHEMSTESLSWERAFLRSLAGSFGGRVNKEAFQQLFTSIPQTALAFARRDLVSLEALLLGQAGLAGESAEDDYMIRLRAVYRGLKRKYRLKPLAPGTIRFLRMRPLSFPGLRAAQLAWLLHRYDHLFHRCIEAGGTEALTAMFRARASDYWNTHYRPGKVAPAHSVILGEDAVTIILVNTVAPFLFLYYRQKDDKQGCESAVNLLTRIPPEENSIVQRWRKLGMAVSDALGSQALLELKSRYCQNRRCTDCAIGHRIFSSSLQ